MNLCLFKASFTFMLWIKSAYSSVYCYMLSRSLFSITLSNVLLIIVIIIFKNTMLVKNVASRNSNISSHCVSTSGKGSVLNYPRPSWYSNRRESVKRVSVCLGNNSRMGPHENSFDFS